MQWFNQYEYRVRPAFHLYLSSQLITVLVTKGLPSALLPGVSFLVRGPSSGTGDASFYQGNVCLHLLVATMNFHAPFRANMDPRFSSNRPFPGVVHRRSGLLRLTCPGTFPPPRAGRQSWMQLA